MKMDLSVVMKTVDKATAPLKKMRGEYGQFTPKIEAAQKALKDKSGLVSNVQALQKLQRQHKANNDAIKVATEKLDKYNAQIKSGKKLTAQQQAQYNKTKEKLGDLRAAQDKYTTEMSKTGRALKKAGVDTKRLASEEQRLTNEHSKAISKLNGLQKRYQKIEAVKKRLGKPFTIGGLKAGAVGLAGLTATATGLLYKINGTAAEMDKLGKTAQNLNMPVEELQALRSQAEHAGVDADNLSGSMFRFTKRLGVLQKTGSGALGSFLKKSKNPLFQELKNAENTDAAYQQLLKAFSKLKSEQEQMAFADAAFGQDGRKMLIMLREGTEGLTAAKKEFQELGGGPSKEDLKAAADYNTAMQKIGEAIESIKFKAVAPILRELTGLFNGIIKKLKNADFRDAAIKQVTQSLKSIGRGIVFLTNYFPEVIAGLLLLKTAFFTLNAVMYANPIGIIIGALAALAIGFTYAYNKSETFREVINGLWGFMKRFGGGLNAIIGEVVRLFLTIPRAIMKMVSMIPDELLPDGWGQSIKKAQQDLEGFNDKFKKLNNQAIKYAIEGESKVSSVGGGQKPVIQNQSTSIIKSPTVQSKSAVDIRVRSDKPVDVEQVKTDNGTDLSVDTGGLFADGI